MLLLLFLCVQDSPAASGQHTGLQVSISSKGLEYCNLGVEGGEGHQFLPSVRDMFPPSSP